MRKRLSVGAAMHELCGIRHLFKWVVMSSNRVRGTRMIDGEIKYFCPITALAYAETGEVYKPWHFVQAAKKIGMSKAAKDAVVDGADHAFKVSSATVRAALGVRRA